MPLEATEAGIRYTPNFLGMPRIGRWLYKPVKERACWTWVGDYQWDSKEDRWYPTMYWMGAKVRVDLIIFRMWQKRYGYPGCSRVVRPASVERKCKQLNCVNPRHMKELASKIKGKYAQP